MRIIFATHNKNKLIEIRRIMGDMTADIVAKNEIGITDEADETGSTFAENSEIKARAVYDEMKNRGLLLDTDIIMADDSGLSIDYLDGAPGIYSARYMGEDTSYDIKNQHLIDELKGVHGSDRAAHFTADICAVFADGSAIHAEGIFPGLIAERPAGAHGFGYDPILYLPEFGVTSAELSPDEKNSISHRGKALRLMREKLAERLRDCSTNSIMKRILVVSDTHKRHEILKKVIEKQKPFDILIHLGDAEGAEKEIEQMAGPDVACCFVLGNNDFFSDLPRELTLEIGGKRCFLTHGHYYGVSMDASRLAEEAKSRDCEIAMFGHTHRPFMKEVNGVLCINPGSISCPRQAGYIQTYMIIEIDRKGELHFTQSEAKFVI